jgi:hypothetical protein
MAALLVAAAITATSCEGTATGNDDEQPSTPNQLSGTITGNRDLDASVVYTLNGSLLVENGGVLNIPAGTRIEAEQGFSNYILVLQGGKINIKGTAAAPVVITGKVKSAGSWGGLIINGKAQITNFNGSSQATMEATYGRTEIANAYVYGGTDNNDNSGSIEYLILEYTGARASVDVEHNGLTLNGVGKGTTIKNLYITNGADDGIEFFGGSVDVENLLVVNPDDDMFDFTQGYCGELKNAYGVWESTHKSTEKDPRGIEADGNLDGEEPDGTPQSDFKVTNVTFDLRLPFVAKDAADFASKNINDVIKIRRGAKATITNACVTGVTHVQDIIDFSDSAGAGQTSSVVEITSGLNNPISGKQVNPDAGYDGAKVEAGHTGADKNAFAWTGYPF